MYFVWVFIFLFFFIYFCFHAFFCGFLLYFISFKFLFQVHENVGQVLADVIHITTKIPTSPLLAQFESETFIDKLFSYPNSGLSNFSGNMRKRAKRKRFLKIPGKEVNVFYQKEKRKESNL